MKRKAQPGKVGRRSVAGQPCQLKIINAPGDWLDAVKIDSNYARVTQNDPVWFGAVVKMRQDAKVRKVLGPKEKSA